MLRRTLFNIARRKICTNAGILRTIENTRKFNSKQCSLFVNYSYYPEQNFTPMILRRFKSKGKTASEAIHGEDEEDVLDVDDYLKTEQSKAFQAYVSSLRLDVIAKVGFNLSRAKIDKEFYKNNIRLNGQKCPKKNIPVHPEDQVDLILGPSPTNPNNLIVNRCILMSAEVWDIDPNVLRVILLVNKNLLIEDYDKSKSDE
ncbi:uncharacterized protein LOC143432951 [Xylocopa sonorina]|uniref:uncharacterized protein LOC143432951 n=1 Tax=Xylocopa sonorina TaxID=1818115 RepID=UPI00403B0F39